MPPRPEDSPVKLFPYRVLTRTPTSFRLYQISSMSHVAELFFLLLFIIIYYYLLLLLLLLLLFLLLLLLF